MRGSVGKTALSCGPDLGTRPSLTLRGGVNARVSVRAVVIQVILLSGILGLVAWSLALGERDLRGGEVWAALWGQGNRLDIYFVNQVRLPRAIAATAVGAAFGVSGAIFQIITGNSLGSPDIIGVSRGAATGAVVMIILVQADPSGIALGAVLGGIVTAGVIYLATRSNGVRGHRLVIVGVGIGATLGAVNTLLVSRAESALAQAAQMWLVGSFNTMTWSKTLVVVIGVAVLSPVIVAGARPLGTLRFGDATAVGLGVPPGWRAVMLIVGIMLVSVATATSGPLAFVAMAAPHLARALTRTSGAGLATSALTGAALVLAADLFGAHAFGLHLPAGVITGAVGGLYLVYVILVERRKL